MRLMWIGVFVVNPWTENEPNNIRVLLNGTGLSQIRETWFRRNPLLALTVELCQTDNRDNRSAIMKITAAPPELDRRAFIISVLKGSVAGSLLLIFATSG